MTKIVLSCLISLGLASAALADDKAAAPAAPAGAPDMSKFGPMVHQPKNEKQDKKELDDFYKAWVDAAKKGDVAALADMMTFPAMMMSNGSKGFGMMEMTKEQWVGMMTPMMEHMKTMPKDAKIAMKSTCSMMDDDLASCEGTHSMSAPSAKMKGQFNQSNIMVRVDGKWKMKSMLESGWGDAPMAPGEAQANAAPPAGSGAAKTQTAAPQGASATKK
jgi:ketosteroid isomerase-like protein